MKFDYYKKQIVLNNKDAYKNYISILSSDRLLVELYDSAGSGKGRYSSVFKAIDPNGEEPELIIKFCNCHNKVVGNFGNRQRERFYREIEALLKARESRYNNKIIEIYDLGERKINKCNFLFYVMEMADYDLKNFLATETLNLQNKVILCIEIMKAVKTLHNMDIYHRDLKPDNIFLVGNSWKIGDLGLIAYRDEDFNLDLETEKIGPMAYLSPEATNKAFANRENEEFVHDYAINDKSDIFQLGKLFWYIFQGDIPTGQLQLEDFKIGDEEIFRNIIYPMLFYRKSARPSIDDLSIAFQPIRERLFV